MTEHMERSIGFSTSGVTLQAYARELPIICFLGVEVVQLHTHTHTHAY